jgi:hypothetical protein
MEGQPCFQQASCRLLAYCLPACFMPAYFLSAACLLPAVPSAAYQLLACIYRCLPACLPNTALLAAYMLNNAACLLAAGCLQACLKRPSSLQLTFISRGSAIVKTSQTCYHMNENSEHF